MKLKFNPNLDYQNEAINSVTSLFNGQRKLSKFQFLKGQSILDLSDDEVKLNCSVISNDLNITCDDILLNLNEIQIKNNLPPTEEELNKNNLDFTIEMETGTGKTYVYLKTIFELNKKYGFTKFIIVVPTIAIKEGVYKTLEITREHFKELYDNINYNFFKYDTSKLNNIDVFARDSNINIMIINIDSFNRSFTDSNFDTSKKQNSTNVIHRQHDLLGGYKPIELISSTRPIVIIDEPQSTVNSPNSKKAIKSLKPLCTLRYSATHRENLNMVYKLDAVDAYEQKLVKEIEVSGFRTQDFFNDFYIKLLEIFDNEDKIKVEIYAIENGTYKPKEVTINTDSDDLYKKSGYNEVYEGYDLQYIWREPGNEYARFGPNELTLTLNDSVGGIDDLEMKRLQIRKTIIKHLEKELSYKDKGIKVLSLFFIDKVSNYRKYENNKPIKGIYAKIFEEEFVNIIKNEPKFWKLYDKETVEDTVLQIHNGYFSIDKNNRFKDPEVTKKGKLKDIEESTFDLIMKDKEILLSFDNPLKFIFSHSALKEGWDNPNVFQICTLNESKEPIKKRQEIGRGLRLCVNQEGVRVKDSSVNLLTVITNEHYTSFVESLQHELETDKEMKFGVLEVDSFAHIKENGLPIYKEGSKKIFEFFLNKDYIDSKGKILNKLKEDFKNKRIVFPSEFQTFKLDILDVIKRKISYVPIRDSEKRKKIELNYDVFESSDNEFVKFWNMINSKSSYLIGFDDKALIENVIGGIGKLNILAPKLIAEDARVTITDSGVGINNEVGIQQSNMFNKYSITSLPNIVDFLESETGLMKKTIVDILIQSKSYHKFKKNPEKYKEEVLKIIKKEISLLSEKGIKYFKIEDTYDINKFKEDSYEGYISGTIFESKKSIYKYFVCDSEKIEWEFAEGLEKDKDVKLYLKLPEWYVIKTPAGNYNPDWAVLIKEIAKEKLYFIVETKGNIEYKANRPSEDIKIVYGKKHFEAINKEINFSKQKKYDDFKNNIEY